MICRVTPSKLAAPRRQHTRQRMACRQHAFDNRDCPPRISSPLPASLLPAQHPHAAATRAVVRLSEPASIQRQTFGRRAGFRKQQTRAAQRVAQFPRRANPREHVARIARAAARSKPSDRRALDNFRGAGVHPTRRLDRPHPIEKPLWIRPNARGRRNTLQIGVAKQVGRQRLKPGPDRRGSGRPRTGADDGKRRFHAATFFGLSYRPRYFSAGYFWAFFTIFARTALEISSPNSLAKANE